MEKSLLHLKDEIFPDQGAYTKVYPDFLLPKYQLATRFNSKAFFSSFKEGTDESDGVWLYVHFPFCFASCTF